MRKNKEKNTKRQNNNKNKHKSSKIIISIIVIGMLMGVGYSAYSLKEKNDKYLKQEQELYIQLAEEQERTEEIELFKAYLEEDAYIIQLAKEKLGMAFPDEIIFQPRE